MCLRGFVAIAVLLDEWIGRVHACTMISGTSRHKARRDFAGAEIKEIAVGGLPRLCGTPRFQSLSTVLNWVYLPAVGIWRPSAPASPID